MHLHFAGYCKRPCRPGKTGISNADIWFMSLCFLNIPKFFSASVKSMNNVISGQLSNHVRRASPYASLDRYQMCDASLPATGTQGYQDSIHPSGPAFYHTSGTCQGQGRLGGGCFSAECMTVSSGESWDISCTYAISLPGISRVY